MEAHCFGNPHFRVTYIPVFFCIGISPFVIVMCLLHIYRMLFHNRHRFKYQRLIDVPAMNDYLRFIFVLTAKIYASAYSGGSFKSLPYLRFGNAYIDCAVFLYTGPSDCTARCVQHIKTYRIIQYIGRKPVGKAVPGLYQIIRKTGIPAVFHGIGNFKPCFDIPGKGFPILKSNPCDSIVPGCFCYFQFLIVLVTHSKLRISGVHQSLVLNIEHPAGSLIPAQKCRRKGCEVAGGTA